MQERMKSVTPGKAGSPMPKKPKRSTQATMAMSITFLMPKRRRKKGMSRMHRASAICESETRSVALLAAKLSAYSGCAMKWVMKGPA